MKEKKNKGGRPPVILTNEQINEIEELAAYLTLEQIADYFGISRDTFQEIRNREKEVFRQYKKGKTRKIYRYAKTLENKALGLEDITSKSDTASLIFFLKTQAGWSEKNIIETKDITPNLKRFNIIVTDDNAKHKD